MITSDEKRLIESIIKSYEGSVGIQHDLVKNMFAKLLNLEFNNFLVIQIFRLFQF